MEVVRIDMMPMVWASPSPERYGATAWSLYRYAMPSRRASLQVRLLGPLEVMVAGRPVDVDTRKALAIVALLAAEGRPFARDELAAMLWPDSDDGAARGALRRTLSTLHAAVGDGPLTIERDRIALVPGAVAVDLVELERLGRSDRLADLARAAQLARGPFLAGFSLRDSVEFDDWRAVRAASVERLVLGLFDRLTAARESAGDIAGAIEAAGRRSDLDPLDEAGHVRLMDLYASAGDRTAAIRQYRTCVATLERELGVTPLAATTARYEAIRDSVEVEPPRGEAEPPHGDDTVGGAVVGPHRLIGREAALAVGRAALEQARAGHGVLLAIVGEAGIGKTALGEAIVTEGRRRGGVVIRARAYPGERGIGYGPLVEMLRDALGLPDGPERVASLDPTIRAELARLLPGLAFGARPAASRGEASKGRLVAALADGLTTLIDGPAPGVLWLDDLHLADVATLEAVAFLARRLDGRRLVFALAWRPEDLDGDGLAYVDALTGSAGATVITLDRLDREAVAGIALASGGGSLDDATIDRLAAASEGLPLYVVEALAAGPGLVDAGMPQGVRAVLRARLTSVSETTAQVLAAASVIGRSFDLATVRYASGRSEEETADAIDVALRRGLVREDGGRYDFAHGALRDLAYEATSLARRRLLHRRAAEAYRLDLARNGRDDLARLVAVAGHERDAGRDAEAAEAFQVAGRRAAEVFANREAIELDEAALALGHPDVVGLHGAIGALRTRLGDYDGAIESLEAAAAAADTDALPGIELALARAHLRRGDLVTADGHLAAGLAIARDPILISALDVDRAIVRRRRGDMDGAAEAAAAARDAASRAGDPASIGAADRLLGLVALDQGDTTAAMASLDRALAAAADDPDPTATIAALTGLAMAAAASGDIDAAVAAGEQAVAACRRMGDRHLEAAVENHLADLLHAAGRDDEAMAHLARAVTAFAEVGGDPADPDPGIWMLAAS